MAHAYTPGLKITAKTKIERERRLPIKGEVIAKIGDKVKAEDIVAQTQLPGDVEPLNVAGLLGVPPEDIEFYLVKHPGDKLKKEEIIAQTKGLFGIFRTTIKSPIDGIFESFSKITGQAILRHPPTLVKINAYIDGVVTQVIESEGVVVETIGTLVQGIFGIGGEAQGVIKKAVNSPNEILTEKFITPDDKEKILIGGSFVSYEAIKKAIEYGCKGIVTGGISDEIIHSLLGYEIGVAITGAENIGITIIVTEGFGKMDMAKKTFDLLCSHEGKKASINGATQIRAGVMRPEVIISLDEKIEATIEEIKSTGVEIGHFVRIIREPYFGKIGKVVGMPPELQIIETGAKVRVFEIQLEDGNKITLPRANVELIEE